MGCLDMLLMFTKLSYDACRKNDSYQFRLIPFLQYKSPG